MAADTNQEERRADTVAIPRQTVKVATWIASIAFVASATFVWNSGTEVHAIRADLKIISLRIDRLEAFGPERGERFTAEMGDKLEQKIEKIAEECDRHKGTSAHREQSQLNREIFWRIKKLEKPNSDNGRHNE